MKKVILTLLVTFSGASLFSAQGLQPVAQDKCAQQLSMDKTMALVEQWSQQLSTGNRSRELVVEEIKQYAQSHPEIAEVYVDHFDTLVFSFNIVDLLLIQAAMYQAHNHSEDSQRLAIAAVLEQAGIKRTLHDEKIQSLAALAMGKYAEVSGLL